MKKFLSLAVIAMLSGSAIFAQDTSTLNRQKTQMDTTSSSSNRSTWDTTSSRENKTWDKNKAPKDKRKNKTTDSLNRRDSL